MKILGIIPARSGSKGLPGKNIKSLAGKPLIGWTIEASLNSTKIDKVICSTDDQKIAEVASAFHCDVPFLRPSDLAKDDIQLIHVVFHAIDWLEKRGEIYDVVLTLQCTSPLRTSTDIDNAIYLFFGNGADSVISVCETIHPPHWTLTVDHSNHINPIFKDDFMKKRRQDLPKTYIPNGAMFINNIRTLKESKNFFNPGSIAYIMDKKNSVDIDDLSDFLYAEFLLKYFIK